MRLRVVILGTPVLHISTGADVMADLEHNLRVAEKERREDQGDLVSLAERDDTVRHRRLGFDPDLPESRASRFTTRQLDAMDDD